MGLKPGDVVVLKSGGPPMTVIRMTALGPITKTTRLTIHCAWFDDGSRYLSEDFTLETLRILSSEGDEPPSIPAAMQRAKDAKAEAMKAERERQWEEDQIRYAHTSGYTLDPGHEPRVTPDHDG